MEFGEQYDIDSKVVDSSDYGVPQVRLRAIIKMHKKGTIWNWPQKNAHKVTVREAIGNLPSLEAGEKSNIKWHFARPHSEENILWMKHTPTGCTAFDNPVYFPQKKDGTPVKGYQSSYRRIRWDAPAPTITMRNDCIASQRNVHPGRELSDGTYSDSLKIIQLAESVNKELFVYVYQPSGKAKDFKASSINISTTINDSISYCNRIFRLLLLLCGIVSSGYYIHAIRKTRARSATVFQVLSVVVVTYYLLCFVRALA